LSNLSTPGRRPTVLFENGEFLVLYKPAGVSMATPAREGTAGAGAVARLLEAVGLAFPEPLPLLVHRLDVGTSGVVLLAKGAAAHRLASLAFQERRVTKTYRALCWGHPVPAAGTFADPLGRDREDGRKMGVDPRGKPALTSYRTLRRYPSLADVELVPGTGRTHQIRVHLAAHGHPIAGDDLYGGATRWHGLRRPGARRAVAALTRPLLHAIRLVLPEVGIEVEAPLPADYAAALAALET